MRCRAVAHASIWTLLTITAIAFSPVAALAQSGRGIFKSWRGTPCCPPPACVTTAPQPCPPSEPAPPTKPPTAPKEDERPAAPEETPVLPSLATGVQGERGVALGAPNEFGEFFGSHPFLIMLQLPPPPVVTQPPVGTQPPFPPPPQPSPRTVTFEVPSPAGGGVVGRTKVSEDNNPLPRDRVIFEYDYFNRVPLTSNKFDVHRFSPGFEKTFFDQRASVEVRVPFASTLDTDLVAGTTGTSRAGEFGDVHVTLKGLVYSSPAFNFAAGLGIAIPTADDTRVFLPGGTELLRIKNESVILTPYFAYLVTPDDRLFFQNWFQIGFDASDNPVSVNPDLAGLREVGNLTDQTILQIDAQVGYWLYRSQDNSRWLTALAPFFEVHYNTALDNADTIRAGALTITGVRNRFDELNLSAGVVAQLGNNCLLSFGAAFPVKGQSDRSFDYQLGIRASIFFGQTARERSLATAPSF
jgi:hypothetical protein